MVQAATPSDSSGYARPSIEAGSQSLRGPLKAPGVPTATQPRQPKCAWTWRLGEWNAKGFFLQKSDTRFMDESARRAAAAE